MNNQYFMVASSLAGFYLNKRRQGDEASLPVLGPNFQLLRHVSLEPFSIAAGGMPAPVKIHFEPSSRESKRLVVEAPMNFSFMGYLGL